MLEFWAKNGPWAQNEVFKFVWKFLLYETFLFFIYAA